MDLSLRVAFEEDVAAVLDLWDVAGENASRPADDAGAVLALMTRDREALILADRDGVLVGSVIAGWDGWRYHLYRLAVHPDHRRQGVATALLDRAEQRLVAFGAKRIDAMVLDNNRLGRSIWAARGYYLQAEWSRWSKEVPESRV
jgi:ribosomal protein S18 acetylase RimI-like enzyme